MSLRCLWVVDSRFNLIFSRQLALFSHFELAILLTSQPSLSLMNCRRYPNVERRHHNQVAQLQEGGEGKGGEATEAQIPPNDQFMAHLKAAVNGRGDAEATSLALIVAGLAPVVLFTKVHSFFHFSFPFHCSFLFHFFF